MKYDIPKHYTIALGELGQREIVGSKHNPRIIEYHAATGLAATDDETSWCGSFVAWCMLQSGVKYDSKKAAAARSWLSFGAPVDEPEIGDLVILWRVSPSDWRGHVGFYDGQTKNNILILGANQDNEVSVKSYPKSQLLGYRRLKK